MPGPSLRSDVPAFSFDGIDHSSWVNAFHRGMRSSRPFLWTMSPQGCPQAAKGLIPWPYGLCPSRHMATGFKSEDNVPMCICLEPRAPKDARRLDLGTSFTPIGLILHAI